jgi:uncharacterized membrane protein YccC
MPDCLDHETAVGLIFAVKTFAASLLALYIAFWAGLDDPRWAFLTVFVVSQPDSGFVLAKSYYRILGTIAGLLVTIALVFALAQYGELFVAALAVWICFCNFAARAERNFASYGFQLAGYTVAIVGIPAALDPNGAYPLLVARFTEILLGIICATLVSRLLLVRELSPRLIESVRALTQHADRFATLLLNPNADRELVAAERSHIAKANLDIQAMQHSAYFESADARVLDQPLRRLIQVTLELCVVAETAASHHIASPSNAEGNVLGNGTVHANDSSAAAVSALVRAADRRDVTLASRRLRQCMTAFERGQMLPHAKMACELWSDPVAALLTGVRSALAVAITSAFWFATAWPNGPTAVVVAAVVCSLLASLEQPEKISMAAAATVLVAAVPVFATQFYLMPLAVDFASMAVALAPLMLTCGFIMAQPRIGPLGLLSAVYFAFASNIDNVMTYDAVAFLNSSLAILVGIAVAVVLFAIFFPETPAFAARRFRKQLMVHLSYLAAPSKCASALSSYRYALCEQLATTLMRVSDDSKAARACSTSAIVALSAAQAVDRLRDPLTAGALPLAVARKTSRLLARLSPTLHNPSLWKLGKRAAEAHTLGRLALAASRASAEADKTRALNGIVVGAQTLGSDLTRARTLLQENSNALRL